MKVNTEYYDDIIIGGGKAGKTLAPALAANGRKTALGEGSLNMIDGRCINIACILTKTMVSHNPLDRLLMKCNYLGILSKLQSWLFSLMP
jgi:pyruvate/2-oxoglutarate dehydrogenase complex dihydrolipoamide dehydrogenase (E3) component